MTQADRWLKRYYPETAEALYARVGTDRVALLRHALKKWRGLRPKVLERYGLTACNGKIENDSWDVVLEIDWKSCTLCLAFMDMDCSGCPLAELRGTYCTEPADDPPPYAKFTAHHDPEPMIKLLERAIRREKRRKP
jgi:hypothetical protein